MMIKVKGVIIKEVVVGEGDKYITLFTKEYGKMQIGASRAKKAERGMASGTQLFVYGEFLVSQYKDTYKLIHVDIINMFHNIREDIYRLSYATYIIEVLNEVITENQSDETLFELTLRALYHLTKSDANTKLIRRVFELRLLKELGLMPNVGSCLYCGESVEEQVGYTFSSEEGGVICQKCQKLQPKNKILYNAIYTMYYVLHTPLKQLFGFQLDHNLQLQFEAIIDDYFKYHIEKEFRSIAFIKEIEELQRG